MSEVLTGYEQVDSKNIVDISLSIDKIEQSMRERNPEKYGDFIVTLGKLRDALYGMYHPIEYFRGEISKRTQKIFGKQSHSQAFRDKNLEIRIELFRCIYYAMRLLDDVVDGDTPEKLTYEQREQLLKACKEGNIEEIPNLLYQKLITHIYELAEKLGYRDKIQEALSEIIESLIFDLERLRNSEHQFCSQDDLKRNFHKMDIDGTIKGTAIIFGIVIDSILRGLTPLGEASRYMYNIRDFGEDIMDNIINISHEDAWKFKITPQHIEQAKVLWNKSRKKDEASLAAFYTSLNSSIKTWMYNQIYIIRDQLTQHKKNMKISYDFIDNPNFIAKKWRNGVLKYGVLPRTYINEIMQVTKKVITYLDSETKFVPE